MTTTEKGEWMRWVAGAVLGVSMTAGGASLAWARDHETRIVKAEAEIRGLQEADRLMRAELQRTHDETRADLAEIKADIKRLLAAGGKR